MSDGPQGALVAACPARGWCSRGELRHGPHVLGRKYRRLPPVQIKRQTGEDRHGEARTPRGVGGPLPWASRWQSGGELHHQPHPLRKRYRR